MNARDKITVHLLHDQIARLKREKLELLQLIDAAPCGFALLDQNLRFLRVNAALKVIDGHLANEHIGQTLREAMPKEASALEPLCREVLRNQTPILNIQISGAPVQGSVKARVCLASIYAVRPDGKALNLGLIMRDVSSYKLETIGHFTSLMNEDFNTVLSSIAGNFNAKIDNLAESHPAFTALTRALDSNEKSAQLIRHLMALAGRSGPLLTTREQQILQLLADGQSSKQIAKALRISFKTVTAHRSTIMKKLDAHEAPSLIRHAIRLGLIQP